MNEVLHRGAKTGTVESARSMYRGIRRGASRAPPLVTAGTTPRTAQAITIDTRPAATFALGSAAADGYRIKDAALACRFPSRNGGLTVSVRPAWISGPRARAGARSTRSTAHPLLRHVRR